MSAKLKPVSGWIAALPVPPLDRHIDIDRIELDEVAAPIEIGQGARLAIAVRPARKAVAAGSVRESDF